MRIVLLIPVRDEEEHLPEVLDQALAVARKTVVVDDGSTDATGRLLRERRAAHPDRLLVVSRSHPGGKSRALREGLEQVARQVDRGAVDPADPLVLADGDGQHPLHVVPELCRRLVASGVDMLVACRDLSAYPSFKRWGNRLLTWQARLLTGVDYRDTQCGLRALRAGRAREVGAVLAAEGYTCEQEMCIGLPLRGWRLANDFAFRPAHARSRSSLGDAFRIALAGVQAWGRGQARRQPDGESALSEEPAPTLP